MNRMVASIISAMVSDPQFADAIKAVSYTHLDVYKRQGYIRLKADASISSKDCYDIYRMWCEENSLTALKRHSFSDALVAACGKYNLEHCNTITDVYKRQGPFRLLQMGIRETEP